MKLTFQITQTRNNSGKTFYGHEPNNDFIEYYLGGDKLFNESTQPYMGDFEGLAYVKEPGRITPHSVRDFGIKSYPGFGAYGFYTPKFGTSSFMVIPINKRSSYGAAPEVTIVDTGTTIRLDIIGDYECYRIIVRQEAFAEEFITYDTMFEFIPMFNGECLISVIGHSNEISITSDPYVESISLVDRTTN